MRDTNSRVVNGVEYWVDENGRVCTKDGVTSFVSLDEAAYVTKMERIRDSFD